MEWSNSRKLKGNAVFTSVVGENSKGLYLMRYRNKFLSKNIIIERYRPKLGLALSKNIILKNSRVLHVELMEDKILFISTKFNRKQMQNEVICQWFDTDVEPLTEPWVAVTSILSDYYDKGDFRVRISNNRKKILISHSEKTSKGNRRLCLDMFDDEMKLSYTKRWNLEMKYDEFSLHDLMIDNDGNAFFLSNNHDLANKRNSEIPMDWKLFWYQSQKDSLSDFSMTDTNFNILGPHFSWDRFQNKVNITAFYTFDGETEIVGLYNFQLYSDNNKPIQVTYKEFGQEFRDKLIGDRPSYGLDEVRNFKILEVIPNSDGGMSLIAERSSFIFESDITYVNGVPQTQSRNIYNYDDVLVMAIDENMDVRWQYLINKSQSSLNDGGYYSSVIVANTRSKLYVIYNDRLRTNGDVIQYTFNTLGEVTYKILIRSEDDFVSVIPGEARQINYNRLILPVSKDKKFALLKLVYPN
jgi:hypothetical protein